MDTDFLDEFYRLIIASELDIFTSSYETAKGHRNIQKIKNKRKISNAFAKGFCKAFAGALLLIVPHPIT